MNPRHDASTLKAPVSYQDKGAALARTAQLVAIVNKLSDHAPCVAEYSVRLPLDYAKASRADLSVPTPRALGDNERPDPSTASSLASEPSGKGQARDVPVDGATGRMTPAAALAPVAVNGAVLQVQRLACLVQDHNSCGVRAAWNARALSQGAYDQLADHEGLVGLLQHRGGALPIDVADNDVIRVLNHTLQVETQVAFLGHFAELQNLHAFIAEPQWLALARVGQLLPGASAVLLINTIGDDGRRVDSRSGYGHYIAVRLDVQGDRAIVAAYADSLAGANDARRRLLIGRLVTQLMQEAGMLAALA